MGLSFGRPWGGSTTIRFFVLLMAYVDAAAASAPRLGGIFWPIC